MADVFVELENKEEVDKAFTRVLKKLSDKDLITRAAMVVERQAKINATERPGPRVRTGRLRSSITSEIISETTARVGTNVVYGSFLEFGTEKMPAYPFLYRTLEQQKDELEGIIATYGKEFGEAWGK
ncbi:MAG: HK97 gp10 family phage protein [Ignavibacteria bacterium]|nr:HK97 gp10 family phage protein [Ignavibacteria bacterium]